ncbi:MAG: hypothetical protein L6R42_001948 [Xanthoria sp. 1 TBL-2021]|nr:MAG: hypothetical protein L6R42_001948 [Xanthoria sp. 1 TBL-2021]
MAAQSGSNNPAQSSSVNPPEDRFAMIINGIVALKARVGNFWEEELPPFLENPTEGLEKAPLVLKLVDWLNEICHREADGNTNFKHMQAILKIYLLVAKEEHEKLLEGNPPGKAEEDLQETDSKKKAP